METRVHNPRVRREIEWEVTPSTLNRFFRLVEQIAPLDMESPEAACLRDEIRRLPGFPQQLRPWDRVNWKLRETPMSHSVKVN